MSTEEARYATTREAAAAVGVSRDTLRRWWKDNRVTPAFITPTGHARWDVVKLVRELQAVKETPVTESVDAPVQQPVVAAIVTSERGLLVTWRNDKQPPAGFLTGEIEPGESPADAMVRECKEEAGLRVRAGQELGRRVHPRSGRTMIYVSGEPVDAADVFVGDSAELADVRWVDLATADEAFQPFGGMFGPVHEHVRNVLGR